MQITPSAALALMINGLPVRAIANNPLLRLLGNQSSSNGRVLVLIQLTGGNDGLNTIIPLDQYSALSNARPNILIPESKVLPLTVTINTGLHPAIPGIQNMYNNGLVNITQGVSYPNPNFSHFRATDIWLTASDATQYLNDGWLGRCLADEYPDYPMGYPSTTSPDPPAIEIGTAISTALIGPNVGMGMSVTDIDSFYNLVNNTVSPAPDTQAGHELTFLRYIAQQTQQYTGVLQAAANKAKNLSQLYPATPNSLADQLKIVARLIAGGLQTPVYMVSLGSFDFHVSQVDAADPTQGSHAILLQKVSEAITAFFDDCKLLQIDDRVTAMAFSEFGRRIISNGGLGTDHGTAQPIMVFGNHVNPGFIGANPAIPQQATVLDNLDMQNDYRSVYAAILSDWFQVSPAVMSDVLMQDFSVLPIFRKDKQGPVVISNDDILFQNYPNPFSQSTVIRFNAAGGIVSILLLDANGRHVKTITKQEYPNGTNQITFSRGTLAAGNYYYYLVNGRYSSTKKMVITD